MNQFSFALRVILLPTRTLAAAVALIPLGGLPMAASAQQAPPEPLEIREVEFPEFEERTLSNGARLIVVPQNEVPFATLNLVLPAGSVADPEGREGTASFVAQLLERGTSRRSAEEFAEAVDFLGASFGASASDEWTTVTLAALSSTLDEGLVLLAEMVLEPAFADEELELLRTRSLSGLQVALSQASALASREFTRLLYGAHPYGRLETRASLEGITHADVLAFHDTWYRPEGALFVVAGAVDADAIAASLEQAFADWTPGGVPAVAFADAPTRSRPEIVLVHKAGTVQAEVRVGHLLPGGDFDEATALSVANQVLGGGASGRLFKVLREERGYTYGAYSNVSRARRASRLSASMAVRTEVAGEAIAELLDLVEQLREEPLPADELSDTQSYLTGVFPLQIETPQQVAAQVTNNRLLGLSEDAIETYRSRVLALDTATVRGAAERYIRPEQLAIIVAGDAAVLQPQLAALGSVRIVDAEGNALTMADLAPKAASQSFHLSGLQPISLTYDVLLQGQVFGEAVRSLEQVDEGWRLSSVTNIGPQSINQQVVVDMNLGFVSVSSEAAMGAQSMTMNASREGDRIKGKAAAMGQEQAIDFAASPDLIISDALELALWVAVLEPGAEISLPVGVLQSGTTENVTLTVAAREEVTVPAGTFDAWRIEVAGSQPQTLWVRVDAPQIPLRITSAAQPIALELKQIS